MEEVHPSHSHQRRLLLLLVKATLNGFQGLADDQASPKRHYLLQLQLQRGHCQLLCPRCCARQLHLKHAPMAQSALHQQPPSAALQASKQRLVQLLLLHLQASL
jgi:hypothetical protein